jgi:hypothetical protein
MMRRQTLPAATPLWHGDGIMLLRNAHTDAVIVVASAGFALGGLLLLRTGNWLGWWLLLASSLGAAAAILRPVFDRFGAPAHDDSLELSAWGVRRFNPDGRFEAMSWNDLSRVSVSTTPNADDGEDVHIRLDGRAEHTLQVAHTLAVESGLLTELATRLEAFDQDAMVEALTRGQNSIAVLWRAPRAVSQGREKSHQQRTRKARSLRAAS